MMKYKYLSQAGALQEGAAQAAVHSGPGGLSVDPAVVELVPDSVARENILMPLSADGETITIAVCNATDVMLADKLTFILNRKIRLVPAPRHAIIEAINRHYHQNETESVDSMLAEFTDTAIDFTDRDSGIDLEDSPGEEEESDEAGMRPKTASWLSRLWRLPEVGKYLGKGIVEFKKGLKGLDDKPTRGQDRITSQGSSGVFYYTVEEGQRVLMRRWDGTMTVIVGPKRVWRGWSRFTPMQHYVAHPGEFLIVRFRDGRQEHLFGPAEIWFDPRIHQSVTVEDALQLATKEAVVVYSRPANSDTITQRIVYGPTLFVPQPGEWLHTFSWHGSKGGHKGVQKEPNALVFQKLWLMPDQMYHDVTEVRTADDAVLTVRLMIFFELIDIQRMLEATHDPIGDFVNAATSDVVSFVGQHDFESFKQNTNRLNDLETYRQLTGRAAQCGYRINKVVYRGYDAPKSLQLMHDQAIESRTRLQLERATEQQAQDLENYKLDCQITRSTKRRTEQTTEATHDLELARQRQEAELKQKEAAYTQGRQQRRQEAELRQEIRVRQDAQQRDHLAVLRDMGVDLTAYLTQGRADRVIELRGGSQPHIHLEHDEPNGKKT